MAVNFPLIPPPQPKAEPKTEQSDPLWNEMKRSLESPTASRNPLEQSMQQMYGEMLLGDQIAPYDQELVDLLKATLIDALRHAANIRNLAADERIIIVIKGPQAAVEDQGSQSEAADPQESAVQGVYNQGVSTSYKRLRQTHHAGAGSSCVLTIRAKKSDIDAFAKGDLNLEKFTKTVEIFLSYLAGPDSICIRLGVF